MIKSRPKTEQELIDEYVASGRVRRFPLGYTSDWDDLPFREKRAMMFQSMKGKRGERTEPKQCLPYRR